MIKIKEIFTNNKKKLISGGYIARTVGITRTAVWKKVRQLQKSGYNIESVKNKGYILNELPDVVDIDVIKIKLEKDKLLDVYGNIKYYYHTHSTQTAAKRLADNKAVEKLAIITEDQDQSYGRFGRKWSSPYGGLWFSIILKPDIVPQNAAFLTLLMSLAVREVLQEYAKKPMYLKWPNDVFADNKKICGILTELSAEIDRTRWVVIGAGININNRIPSELSKTAVSLAQLCKRKFERTELFYSILKNFGERYKKFLISGFYPFKSEYRKNLLWINKNVKAELADESVVKGRIFGINRNGFLILQTDDHRRVVVPSGDLYKT
ncbi:MAG: biotin--[acetyl-CoA-carboxylase] ligase [bacterium]